jgi:hypothetical protein
MPPEVTNEEKLFSMLRRIIELLEEISRGMGRHGNGGHADG